MKSFTAQHADTGYAPDNISYCLAYQLAPPQAPYYFVNLVREYSVYRAKLSVVEGIALPPDGVYLFSSD
jgi:hypothetical protein